MPQIWVAKSGSLVCQRVFFFLFFFAEFGILLGQVFRMFSNLHNNGTNIGIFFQNFFEE